MRIVQLTTDIREHNRQYFRFQPEFATMSEALLIGFSRIPGIEVHVVSCIKQPVSSPAKLNDNIFFHSLTVSKSGWLRTGYQGCVRAVRRKLREIQPDIVQVRGPNATARSVLYSAVSQSGWSARERTNTDTIRQSSRSDGKRCGKPKD